MNIYELRDGINLIKNMTIKMNRETIPYSAQRIIIKIYANNLNFNLTDNMVDNIIQASDIRM